MKGHTCLYKYNFLKNNDEECTAARFRPSVYPHTKIYQMCLYDRTFRLFTHEHNFVMFNNNHAFNMLQMSAVRHDYC